MGRASFVTFMYFLMSFGTETVEANRFDHGVNIDTTRPLIVAHRGFSGAYPEHTVLAYQKAIEEGADIIECDVCLTKDLQPVCLHEAWLSTTTDVESRPEYSNRKKVEIVYGNSINDWFTFDFTLEELKTLKVRQRFSFRDPSFDGQHSIASLEEYISVAKSASRTIGIYPETKDPAWVNSKDVVKNSGKQFEDILLEKLEEFGYTQSTDPCFVQSFDEDSIKYMAPKTNLPLVQLIHSSGNVSQAKLEEHAKRAYGIGPSKRLIVNHYSLVNGEKNWISETTDLVTRAHALGLKVHPYTTRNENQYLAWDYKQDPWYEYEKYYELGVDGLFTDFTPSMKRFLDWQYREDSGSSSGTHLIASIITLTLTYFSLFLSV